MPYNKTICVHPRFHSTLFGTFFFFCCALLSPIRQVYSCRSMCALPYFRRYRQTRALESYVLHVLNASYSPPHWQLQSQNPSCRLVWGGNSFFILRIAYAAKRMKIFGYLCYSEICTYSSHLSSYLSFFTWHWMSVQVSCTVIILRRLAVRLIEQQTTQYSTFNRAGEKTQLRQYRSVRRPWPKRPPLNEASFNTDLRILSLLPSWSLSSIYNKEWVERHIWLV